MMWDYFQLEVPKQCVEVELPKLCSCAKIDLTNHGT